MTILKSNKIVLTIILLVFFVGDNILTTFGIPLPQHKLILLLLCSLSLFKLKITYREFPQIIHLLVFCFVYTLFKVITGGQGGNTMMGVMVMLPILVYIAFRSLEKPKNILTYKSILYIGYLFECCISIAERILHMHFFKWQEDIEYALIDFDVTEFRSFGLFGHPLQNAVVVEVFILFILIYERNIKRKYFLAILGVVAIFCFNTRAAIVMSSVSVAFYTLYWVRTERVSIHVKMALLIAFVAISAFVYHMFTQGLIGGRLSSMGLYDEDSAGVRIEVWNIFNYYELKDFVFGISEKELVFLKSRLGLIAVENFWFNWMLTYGVVFVVGLVLFYIPVFKKIFSGTSLFTSMFLTIPFITLASTNPSLAVSIVPVSSFLLLSYIMPMSNINNYRQ